LEIYLNQHIGEINKSIVNEGDKVIKGQLIAIPENFGANIHASVSGHVKKIDSNSIFIEPDKAQDKNDYLKIPDKDNKLELVKEAGVVGAGGAGFPTHIKLDVDLSDGVVIANAAECEPILNHNIKLIEEDPEIIFKGMEHILDITGANKGYIAIKNKNVKALIALKSLVSKYPDIEIRYIPDIYPAGDERVIIREILNIDLEPGVLPHEVGALVQNVETIKNIFNAIEKRKPVITKDITVGGRVEKARKGQVFLDQPLGKKIGDYIEKVGGLIEPAGSIYVGGPYINQKVNINSAITKVTSGVLVGMPQPNEKRKLGLLACSCGASVDDLKDIASDMGAEVASIERCKRMVKVNNQYKCEKPGSCPGQTEKVLALKNQGAKALLVGTCDD